MSIHNETSAIYPKQNESRTINICKMLDTAIDQPKSYEAKLMMPESLGLYGTRCPITAVRIQLTSWTFRPRGLLNGSMIFRASETWIPTFSQESSTWTRPLGKDSAPTSSPSRTATVSTSSWRLTWYSITTRHPHNSRHRLSRFLSSRRQLLC